eukprot:ctg_3233.g554
MRLAERGRRPAGARGAAVRAQQAGAGGGADVARPVPEQLADGVCGFAQCGRYRPDAAWRDRHPRQERHAQRARRRDAARVVATPGARRGTVRSRTIRRYRWASWRLWRGVRRRGTGSARTLHRVDGYPSGDGSLCRPVTAIGDATAVIRCPTGAECGDSSHAERRGQESGHRRGQTGAHGRAGRIGGGVGAGHCSIGSLVAVDAAGGPGGGEAVGVRRCGRIGLHHGRLRPGAMCVEPGGPSPTLERAHAASRGRLRGLDRAACRCDSVPRSRGRGSGARMATGAGVDTGRRCR